MNDFLDSCNNNGDKSPDLPEGLSVQPCGLIHSYYYIICNYSNKILTYLAPQGEWVKSIFLAQAFFKERAETRLAELAEGREEIM